MDFPPRGGIKGGDIEPNISFDKMGNFPDMKLDSQGILQNYLP